MSLVAEGPRGGIRARPVLLNGPGARRSVLLAVVAAELAAGFAILRNSTWVLDDNILLGLARQHGFTFHWLNLPVFGHWGIGYHIAYSVINHFMPLDYRWLMVVMFLVLGASALVFHRILTLLFGDRWLAVAVAALFAASPLFVRAIQWSAFGLQAIPTVACDLVVVWGYLEYLRRPSRRWIAVSAGALVVGLLFYEKPVLAPLYVFLLRLLFLTPEVSLRSVAGFLRRERWLWLSYAVVIVVWFVLDHVAGGNLGSSGSPSASQWIHFFGYAWFQTVVPAAVGLVMPRSNPYAATGLSDVQTAAVVALQIVLLVLIGVSLMRKRQAWRAWACLGLLFLINGVLVGQARIVQFGPVIGGDLHYWTDFSWLFPLLVWLALSRSVCFHPASQTTPSRTANGVPGDHVIARGMMLLLALLAGGYLWAAGTSAAKLQREWPGSTARSWVNNFETGLKSVSRVPAALLAQGEVPWYLIAPPDPGNRFSDLAPLYGPAVRIDGPLTDELFTVTPTGTLVRARTQVLLNHPISHCFAAGGAARTLTLAPSEKQALPVGTSFVEVRYRADAPTTVPVRVNDGLGYAATADPGVQMFPVARASIAWLGSAAVKKVALTVAPPARLCINTIAIVEAVPR